MAMNLATPELTIWLCGKMPRVGLLTGWEGKVPSLGSWLSSWFSGSLTLTVLAGRSLLDDTIHSC